MNGEEVDQIDYLNLLCNLAEEERTFYDLNDEELELIMQLSEKFSDTGRSAAAVLSMLFNIPIPIPCELTGNCEEERGMAGYSEPQKDKVIKDWQPDNFPNPASYTTTIPFPNELRSVNNLILTIYNLMGNIVMEQSTNENINELVIDIKNLNSGIYYYHIQSGNNHSKTGKMIVINE